MDLRDVFNIFNPRRISFDVNDPQANRIQIPWEHKHLALAKVVVFNFCAETLAPITLFEYGKELAKVKHDPSRRLYVNIHHDYKRRDDVIIQTELENPLALTRLYVGGLAVMVGQMRKDYGV